MRRDLLSLAALLVLAGCGGADKAPSYAIEATGSVECLSGVATALARRGIAPPATPTTEGSRATIRFQPIAGGQLPLARGIIAASRCATIGRTEAVTER